MNELITTTKNNSKAIIKNLSNEARIECDKVFALTETVDKAAKSVNDALRTFEPQLCDSFSKIAADKDGIKKAGYDNFASFAAAAFGINDKAASMYKRVGDKFFNVEKRPVCAAWYTVSKLQELRNVPAERLDKDASDGILMPDMTLSALREYAARVQAESITDGVDSVSIEPSYDGYYFCDGAVASFSNATESDIVAELFGNFPVDMKHVHRYTSADRIVIPAKDDKHKDKEKKLFVIVAELPDGNIHVAKFSEHDFNLPAGMTRKQYAALKAAGLDDEAIRKFATIK